MSVYFKLCFFCSILLQHFTHVVLESTFNSSNSSCIQAAPAPTNHTSCVPLLYYSSCKKKGVQLDRYVFVSNDTQMQNDYDFNRFDGDSMYAAEFLGFSFSEKCKKASNIVYCHDYYPRCDSTTDSYKVQTLCRETCQYFTNACSYELKIINKLRSAHVFAYIIDCVNFPLRNAGESPECYYIDERDDVKGNNSSKTVKDDCLYRDGRGYQGYRSVTSSGIPCQSWTAQCPHRHTMVSTYPELKNSSNYCRNLRGSGQRPWCFTSDKNKRWEYCDIKPCLTVNGSYGNWTLNRECNSTCGQGIEQWMRFCDSPAPRYGGNNCSLSGNATEYRNCSNLQPCPINGNYGKWTRKSTCNVTCGDGFEMWSRKCDNPTPANGGNSCFVLGEGKKWEQCHMIPCVEKRQTGLNVRKIVIGSVVGPVVFITLIIFGILGYRWMKRKYEPYAILHFDKTVSMQKPVEKTKDLTLEPDAASTNPKTYENINENGEPLPGACRGIIPHQQHYVNLASLNRPHYSKLMLFSSMTLDWLRNTWGQVDELGKHVYDVLFRRKGRLSHYDKLKENDEDFGSIGFGTIENSNAVYDDFHRPVVLIPGASASPCEELD